MLRKLLRKYKKQDLQRYAVVLLGLIGMACILFSSFADSAPDTPVAETRQTEETPEEYRCRMQEELAQILASMSGVGRVQVLVTVSGSEEYHYATQGSSLVTDEQVKHSNTYVTVGGSKEQALVESVAHPAITGVVVACDGASRSTVQESVYRAVSVACGISTAQIYVTGLSSAG